MPWNGDFGIAPTSVGFDWRLRGAPGVTAQRISISDGYALRLRFIGRPVARTGLEQPLLLGPGTYVLRWRARTDGLRSEQGLAWELVCGTGSPLLGQGATVREAVTWTTLEMTFEIPADGCDGQWLRLVNPAPRGVAQALRGELQLTDVEIRPAAVR